MTTKVLSGDIGTYEFPSLRKIVNSGAHPPIYKVVVFKAGQGKLPAGLLVALDKDGLGVPYDPNATISVPEQTLEGTCTIPGTPPQTGTCEVTVPGGDCASSGGYPSVYFGEGFGC